MIIYTEFSLWNPVATIMILWFFELPVSQEGLRPLEFLITV
jgi:hypothetical protein